MTSNKHLARIFKSAKTLLAINADELRYRDKYICHAIEDDRGFSETSKRDALAIISDRLHPYTTVEAWLHNAIGLKYGRRQRTSVRFCTKLQQYRRAWLDSLVEEFSK